MPKPLDELEQQKAALELRLDWLRKNEPANETILSTLVKLNNVKAIIAMYRPHDITPSGA